MRTKNLWMTAIIVLGGFFIITFASQNALCQGVGENTCPLCGRPWQGRTGQEVTIPEKLPVPENQKWLGKLRQVLRMAKLAEAQYEANQKKFGITNPYRYIIPQLGRHIDLISKLFASYGLPADDKPFAIHSSSTILEALENDEKLAGDLASQYEWLLNHAEDKYTKRALNSILTQTKMDYIMFDNVIRLFKIEGTIAPLLM